MERIQEFATYYAITELERFRFRQPIQSTEEVQQHYNAANEPDPECELIFDSEK